jgi:LysR family hydrogen peroxide-inducible transcriptional activator
LRRNCKLVDNHCANGNSVSKRAFLECAYLLRESCEYKGYWLSEIHQLGIELPVAFRSEREDWIRTMVAGGFGISFVPEFSPLIPGINLRRFSDRMIEREVSLVCVADTPLNSSAAEFARFAAGWNWNGHPVYAAAHGNRLRSPAGAQ